MINYHFAGGLSIGFPAKITDFYRNVVLDKKQFIYLFDMVIDTRNKFWYHINI